MPSKQFLMELAPNAGQSLFNEIFNYAKENLTIKSVCFIKLLANGQKEVCVKNALNEMCTGVGDTKPEALAECISLKYPE